MIYSNRILRDGLVVIPVLPEGLSWDIQTASSGEAFLAIVGSNRCDTGYIKQLSMPSDTEHVLDQLQHIELAAMSLMFDYTEDANAHVLMQM